MDFIIDNLWVFWLAVAAIMLFVEINTAALVSIWFVLGAVITAVLAVFVDNFWVQLAVFAVSSAVLLAALRNYYRKKLRPSTSADVSKYSMVGKSAVASENITQHSGKVLVGDVYWRAVCVEDEIIRSGSRVIITAENGTTLTVRADEAV